jgi:hypothetical protein
MSTAPDKPMHELKVVLERYEHEFDEPESVQLIAHVRAAGLLTDSEWQKLLVWLDEAMQLLIEMESADTAEAANPDEESYGSSDEEADDENDDDTDAISPDDDPRNADWIRIVGAQRRSGHMLPSWAGLWLWWIGFDREVSAWWGPIGEIAHSLGTQPFDTNS